MLFPFSDLLRHRDADQQRGHCLHRRQAWIPWCLVCPGDVIKQVLANDCQSSLPYHLYVHDI